MSEKEKLEIFTGKWRYGELPHFKASKQKIDYCRLAVMGSCFARNLHRWLNFNGYTDRQAPWDILYNPFSIHKEIKRLYSSVPWETHTLYELGDNREKRYRDPWRTWHAFGTFRELRATNKQFDKQAKVFLENSNGLLITLGLSEVWSPEESPEVILNQVPVGAIHLGEKRWVSRFASVFETYQSLEATVALIRQKVTPDGPIIFTLSPVPLRYTVSGLSIREANNISKATLLIALRKLTTNRVDVDYFPSYEMVQALSEQPNNSVWQADGRHVSAKIIEMIANKFLDKYGRPAEKGNDKKFWVPRVNEEGKITGRLYVDGAEESNP